MPGYAQTCQKTYDDDDNVKFYFAVQHFFFLNKQDKLSHITTKPVLAVSNQVGLKPAYSTTKAS